MKPKTSSDLNSLIEELRQGDDRAFIVKTCQEIETILLAASLTPQQRSYIEIGRGAKKNFAQRFSTSLAQKIADAVRPTLRSVFPDEHGKRHETRALGAAGPKKLDVVHMTPEMGVGLAVSIKTINFRDETTRRYTKNIRRADGELRAEAADYHRRQPWAVFAALIFLPADSAEDGPGGKSSLRHAWDVFRLRAGRQSPNDDHSLFEVVYICAYESEGAEIGSCKCYSVAEDFPSLGLPPDSLTLTDVVADILRAFAARNRK